MIYPEIDPVVVDLGVLKIHWYGVMYLLGFAGAWWLARYRANQPESDWSTEQVDDLIFYGALGVVIGGRVGSLIFYGHHSLLEDPFQVFRVWEGGMSFHGGFLGVLVAMWLFCRKTQKSFFTVTDFIAPLVPVGLATGRIGNFINGELWGKISDVPWAMQLPCYRFPEFCTISDSLYSLPRHPSQMYEAILEGLVLFVILWFYSAKPKPRMAVSGMFLLGYGSFRFLIEFIRLPDAHIGYLAFNWLTMGQLLTIPMLLVGVWLMVMAYQHKETS